MRATIGTNLKVVWCALLLALCNTSCDGSVAATDGIEVLDLKAAPEMLTFEEYKERRQADYWYCDLHETEEALLHEYEDLFLLPTEKSVVGVNSGDNLVWSRSDQLDITFCMDDGLNSLAGYPANFKETTALPDALTAMLRWEQMANVRFIHVPSEDDNCTTSTAVEIRIHHNANLGGGCSLMPYGDLPDSFGACAAPSTAISLALNYIATYNTNDPIYEVGLMTHELGHALGLMHEDYHSDAGACSIAYSGSRDLTSDWDSLSVMGPGGCSTSWDDGKVSRGDANGAAVLYGIPTAWTMAVIGG